MDRFKGVNISWQCPASSCAPAKGCCAGGKPTKAPLPPRFPRWGGRSDKPSRKAGRILIADMRQQGRDNAYAVTDPLSTLAAVDLEALEQLFAEGIHGFRHVIHGIEQIEGHDRLHDIELKQLLYPDAFSAASGESRIHTGWQEFPFSYAEACAAAAVTRFQQQSHLRFDELGTYRLFFYVSDQQLLRTMRDEQLRPLQHYDEAHHAHLLDTLRAYLFHGNSLQQTAALTFTHRNTVNYRMNKIREITGSDFSDSVVCFHYILAFYLDDYLNLHEATAKTT